jgi:hypothetical protein
MDGSALQPDADAQVSTLDAASQLVPCGADDACGCGSFVGRSYRLCAGPLAFADAQADCQAHGMSLVRVDDAAENAWLASAGAEILLAGFASLGASDEVDEGTWRWLQGDSVFWLGDSGGSGTAGAYQNWGSNKPFGNQTRNCAGMVQGGSWEDRSCTAETAYFCELP